MPKKIRSIRIRGDIATVQLTRDHEAIIDADCASWVGLHNWHCKVYGNKIYAGRNKETDEKGRRGMVSMHRAIMGFPVGLEVDHINGNGLDNRRENLRIATKSQNQCNRKISSLNTSGFKGVSPYRRFGKTTWHARISKDGHRISLGYHKTPSEAHAAYLSAREKLHGSFGRNAN